MRTPSPNQVQASTSAAAAAVRSGIFCIWGRICRPLRDLLPPALQLDQQAQPSALIDMSTHTRLLNLGNLERLHFPHPASYDAHPARYRHRVVVASVVRAAVRFGD